MALDDSYSKALLHFDTDLTDESGKTWTAYGNAAITTAQQVFGSGSLALDGSGDYISTPHHTDLVFGSGDFSIDFRIRATASGQSNNSEVVTKHTDATQGAGYAIDLASGTYNLRLKSSSTGSSWDVCDNVAIGTLTQNTWAHVAICRSGNSIMTFFNGTKTSTTTSSATLYDSGSSPLLVGGGNFASTYLAGNIDELRVSKGIARWTDDFTLPTAQYGASVTTVNIDTLRRLTTGVTVNTDTLRRLYGPASVSIDLLRRLITSQAADIDTLRQLSLATSVSVDTLRQLIATVSVPADTSRRKTVPFGYASAPQARPVIVTVDTYRRLE